jgi:hypothetical protein
MAVLFRWYDVATQKVSDGTWNSTGAIGSASLSLASQPITVCLIKSTYTFSAAHTVYGDVSAQEIGGGTGYTVGGAALAALTYTQAAPVSNLTATNPSWTASGAGIAAFRYAVFYINATVGGVTKPLMFAFDNNGSDVAATPSGQTLLISFNATGIFQHTHS